MSKSAKLWILSMKSSLSFAAAFFILLLLNKGLVHLAIQISDFGGSIVLEGFQLQAQSEKWILKDIMWLYLFPYAVLFSLYMLVNYLHKYQKKINNILSILLNWAYVLLLTLVFFLPLFEILNHNGIYHALNWLSFNEWEKLATGVLLMLYFVFRITRISNMFSVNLLLPSFIFVKRKDIIKQLPYLWYIPFLIVSLLFLLSTNFKLIMPTNYLMLGIAIIILINFRIISSYTVLVK